MREFRKIYDLDILNLKPIFHDKIYNIEFFSVSVQLRKVKFGLNFHFFKYFIKLFQTIRGFEKVKA